VSEAALPSNCSQPEAQTPSYPTTSTVHHHLTICVCLQQQQQTICLHVPGAAELSAGQLWVIQRSKPLQALAGEMLWMHQQCVPILRGHKPSSWGGWQHCVHALLAAFGCCLLDTPARRQQQRNGPHQPKHSLRPLGLILVEDAAAPCELVVRQAATRAGAAICSRATAWCQQQQRQQQQPQQQQHQLRLLPN
jgi:hypothetical protein